MKKCEYSFREKERLPISLRLPKVMFWSASYSGFAVYTKTVIHLSVGESGGHSHQYSLKLRSVNDCSLLYITE